MIATHALFPRLDQADDRSSKARRPMAWLAALALLWLAPAYAENVLEDITFTPGPGGEVDVVMKLSEPPVAPKLFTTDSPPRIAVDFDNTRNALTERRLTVGIGSASAISAIEAAGRRTLRARCTSARSPTR